MEPLNIEAIKTRAAATKRVFFGWGVWSNDPRFEAEDERVRLATIASLADVLPLVTEVERLTRLLLAADATSRT